MTAPDPGMRPDLQGTYLELSPLPNEPLRLQIVWTHTTDDPAWVEVSGWLHSGAAQPGPTWTTVRIRAHALPDQEGGEPDA